MTATAQKTKTQELTIVERAQQALSVEHTESDLKKMAAQYADVTEIKDDTDYELVKSGGIALGKVRVAIEKAGKAARDDANAFAKAVIVEQRRLTDIISPEEDRLKALRKDKDNEAIRAAAEKLRVEEERKAAIQVKIDGIRGLTGGLLGASSEALRERLEEAQAVDVTEAEYQEFVEAAQEAKQAAIQLLEPALNDRLDFEQQKAESDRIAAEQAERQAELDRQAAEIKAQQDAERAKLEAEQAEVRRQQEAIDAEKRAEAQKKLAAERAEAERVRQEKERLEREAKEREAEIQRKLDEEAEAARQKALLPEKEKVRQWAESLRYIECPPVKDKKLAKLAQEAMHDVNNVGTDLLSVIDAL